MQLLLGEEAAVEEKDASRMVASWGGSSMDAQILSHSPNQK